MEKEEKNVIDQVVETPVENNDVPVVESTENKIVEENQDENQEDNITVDDNTEVSTEPETDEPIVTEPVITEPVVDNPVELGTDAPVEDPTLATTDEVIPAPVDVPGEPVVDPVVVDNPPVDTVIPEDPAALAPSEPVVDAPVENPVVDDIVGPGPEATCACGDPNCDGNCGVGPEPCTLPCVTVANLFGTLQECVTIIWRYHLKTRKHHVHVDLADFYNKALDVVDDIIERYQGIVGVVDDPFTNCIVGDGKDEITYLQELKNFVELNKSVLGDHSEINSAIDDFLGLIDTTLYKLTSFCENAVKSFEEYVYEDYKVDESCCDPNDGEEEEEE